MFVYHKNNKAMLISNNPVKEGSSLINIYDPVLELRVDFEDKKVVICGNFNMDLIELDSLCIGYTNADLYKFTAKDETVSGKCNNKITIHNFDTTLIINSFELELEGIEPIYLGYLFTGQKTVLPRFIIGSSNSINLPSESSRSFGGQAYGARRRTLNNFAASFKRITNEDKKLIEIYIDEALNTEAHIIDPYAEARDEFPPMYGTLSISDLPFEKRPESGFFWDCNLSWREAR